MNIQPSVIIFAGVVISAIGGFWAYQRQDSFKLKPAIMILIGVVINATGGLWASQQTAQLNQELMNSISGGDSFCYLTVGNIDSVKNIGQFVILHEGKHPLYDVHVRIVDLDKWDQHKGEMSFATLKQLDTSISLGTLIPSSAQMLHRVPLGNDNTRRFNIFFSARNGFFNQSLRFKKIHGKWVRATKVMRGGGDEVIYEKVDDEFPRTAEGNVEW